MSARGRSQQKLTDVQQQEVDEAFRLMLRDDGQDAIDAASLRRLLCLLGQFTVSVLPPSPATVPTPIGTHRNAERPHRRHKHWHVLHATADAGVTIAMAAKHMQPPMMELP